MSLLSSFLPRGLVPQSMATIDSTRTLTYTEDVFVLVVLVGAGGGGAAAAKEGTDVRSTLIAQGGGAGGVCFQLMRLEANKAYTFTIGSGGAGGVRTGWADGASNGSAGGNTTLTATGLSTITANGGAGGVGVYHNGGSYNGTDVDWQTSAGGSGADLIFKGGPGGYVDALAMSSIRGFSASTGGGAVNIFGLPVGVVSGGDVVLSNGSADHPALVTGGGGCGGSAGAVFWTSSAGGSAASGGGGTGGRGVDISTTAGTSAGGRGTEFTPSTLLAATGAGGHAGSREDGEVPQDGEDGGPGAGGGGAIEVPTNASTATSPAVSTPITGGNGGIFGGGGGAGDGQTDNYHFWGTLGGAGGLGGGGGGATSPSYSTTTKSQNITGGAGGGGVALIFFMTDFGKVVI